MQITQRSQPGATEFPPYPGWLARVIGELESSDSNLKLEVCRERYEGSMSYQISCGEKQSKAIIVLRCRTSPHSAVVYLQNRGPLTPASCARPRMEFVFESENGYVMRHDSREGVDNISKMLTSFFTSPTHYPLKESEKVKVTNDHGLFVSQDGSNSVVFGARIAYFEHYLALNKARHVKVHLVCKKGGVEDALFELDLRLSSVKGAKLQVGYWFLMGLNDQTCYVTSKYELQDYFTIIDKPKQSAQKLAA